MVAIKTTLTIGKEIYKAAKRMAVEQDTTVSAMVRKGLLLYLSDPEGVEETVSLLMNKGAMEAIEGGEKARQQKKKDYYVDWDKLRDL